MTVDVAVQWKNETGEHDTEGKTVCVFVLERTFMWVATALGSALTRNVKFRN